MLSCHDNFEANFDNYPSMLSYHQALSMASSWHRCKVKDLHVEPLDPTAPLYGHPSAFAAVRKQLKTPPPTSALP